MNQTQNYQLNQWEAADKVRHQDFNADNAKIDAALGAKCGIVTGSYTGDGEASRTIPLGFTPKAVLLFQRDGGTSYNYTLVEMCGGLILPDSPLSYRGSIGCKIVENGFFVSYYTGRAEAGDPAARTNRDGTVYNYLAFR